MMLARTLLHLTVLSPGVAHPRHLRAFVATLLEPEGDQDHRANVKPFTVAPPQETSEGFALPVCTLDPSALERLLARVEHHVRAEQPLRLGGLQVRFAPAGCQTEVQVGFEELMALANDAQQVDLELVTPTVFRSGRRGMLPFPVPSQVFGHYRGRWNAFAPDGLPCELAFDDLGLEIVAFDGYGDHVVDGHRRRPSGGSGSRRPAALVEVSYLGYVGTVSYRANGRGADAEARRWLHALAAFGVFCGTGANTTIGMGVTRYLGGS